MGSPFKQDGKAICSEEKFADCPFKQDCKAICSEEKFADSPFKQDRKAICSEENGFHEHETKYEHLHKLPYQF